MRGTRWRRWSPAVVLAAVQLAAWGAMFAGGMSGVAAWLALLTVVPALGGIALLVTGAYAVWKRRLSAPIAVTIALALLALWPGAWNFGILQIAYPASREDTSPAITVRLPSDSPVRVAWGGDRLATNQHAFTPDQRWAYDLVIEPYFHGAERVEQYGCWDTVVVAPTTARVHMAHDGEPDETPGALSFELERPLGNFVVLELETRTYLVIAHLRRGSVSVRPGEVVHEGQPIARCGNSGNTSEPHIHIHHQRQDPAHYPVNFAEGLPLYFRDHDGPRMPNGGVGERAGRAVATGDVVRHLR